MTINVELRKLTVKPKEDSNSKRDFYYLTRDGKHNLKNKAGGLHRLIKVVMY